MNPPAPYVSNREHWGILLKPADLAIYIVDDDSSVSGALMRLVRSAGFVKVGTFNSAEDFLKHAVLEGGCLLILDVLLPGKSGIELQQHIRRSGLSVPVVFISAQGHQLESARKQCPEAMAFLLKPFEEGELLKVVRLVSQN
jgi:two-component system response regulator FixJ